ncbi:WhiB family transcriptional regulator [Streptomyces sp. NPDC004562]|uniref:WhiB family transcriptional regulator n=1 Tax=Streptomyces sp. NPDC004562 TaxID=3364703 RepID=UPI0036C19EDA
MVMSDTPFGTPPARRQTRAGGRLNWLEDAGCRGLDTELFFPAGPKGPGRRQADEAKAVCRMCPVRRQCASWALATAQQYGIWGGMDEEERVVAHRRGRLSTRENGPARMKGTDAQ